ncbi:hypothetical protein SAMN02745166_01998 [Prosthecobacter debontii]|uniref:Capsule polysaccharide biosynthesis protein n=1 Tax=Prosthecobacter debontii TaxID=48467 RepID=A0A1T4XTJ6_9BACT|nr:hypothetical protein [Prosthecobacter debontii]SKA92872.1 hypothetical protein SAMN02745166_01998 [Prosthecobacter debontii]
MARRQTLLVAGSLAPNALSRYLKEADLVLEIDTQLERSRYPQIKNWLAYSDIIGSDQVTEVHQELDQVLTYFLEHHLPLGDLPVHRAFRVGCLSMDAKRLVLAHIVGRIAALRVLKSDSIARIVAIAGNGVQFSAWLEVASEMEIPVTCIDPEPTPFNAWRLLKKWWYKRQQRSVATNQPVLEFESADSQQIEDAILCSSERVARFLAKDPSATALNIKLAPTKNIAGGQDLNHYTKLYDEWWKAWQQRFLNEGPVHQALAPHCLRILRDLGAMVVKNSCPKLAISYLRAKSYLADNRPKLLLCDTQVDTTERMWALAAQEAGIPVAAYVYDHLPDPKQSFIPNFLFCDSGRTIRVVTERGFSKDILIPVRSHRQANLSRSLIPTRRPLVVFADSYYAGVRADISPRYWFPCYEMIVQAARALPELDFAIKLHPLRGKREASFGFTAFDEKDVLGRQEFFRQLHPPRNVKLIDPEVNLSQMLNRTSILLHVGSTASIEAFEMGIAVIFLKDPPPDAPSYIGIKEFDACRLALDAPTLIQHIRDLVSRSDVRQELVDNQRRFLKTVYWPPGPSLVEGIQSCLNKLG